MRTLKTFAAAGAALVLGVTLSACGGRSAEEPASGAETEAAVSGEASGAGVNIGVALPQKTSQNWVEAEEMFKTNCAEAGANCTIQFANSGVAEQQNQISAMIENGAEVLVIGAIDGSQLGTQLAQAKAAGIKVIAYDRLLTNTEDVDYYIAYDNFGVGQLQGQALLEGLESWMGPKDSYEIELFAGSPDDSNSAKFFDGAMDVLQPEIDGGKLVVKSGQDQFTKVTTQGWDPKNAQNRMAAILTSTYTGDDEVPDGVLSPNDTLARAIITSVDQAGKPIPVVTGQDSEDESITWVVQGRQYSTIFKDTRALVDATVELALAVAAGDAMPMIEGVTIDEVQYESIEGSPVIAYLLTPTIVTKENAAEVYADDPHRIAIVEAAQE